MINREQFGFDPLKLTKKLGLQVEIPPKVPETNRLDIYIAASLRDLYKFMLPVYTYILDKNSNLAVPPAGATIPEEDIESLDHRNKIIDQLILLQSIEDRNNTGQFVGNVIDGFIGSTSVVPVASKSDRTHNLFSFHSEFRKRNHATPEGVLALGILGLHHLGIREMNGEAKKVEKVLNEDRTARDEKPIYLTAIEPYKSALMIALQHKSDKLTPGLAPAPAINLGLEIKFDGLMVK